MPDVKGKKTAPPSLTLSPTGVMLLKRRQPDKPAAALNKFCSIRTLNGIYTEFGIDPKHTDWHTYKERYLIENLFIKLKNSRCFANRYEKKALYFFAVTCLACILAWLLLMVLKQTLAYGVTPRFSERYLFDK